MSRDAHRLAVYFGADKPTAFIDQYERRFQARRSKVRAVLEIGIYRGGSLRMWRGYFPNAIIVGLDIKPKPELDDDRIVTYMGDQTDTDMLAEIAERHGPFDLVIDDGSHMAGHAAASYASLIGSVAPGGWYAIEDTHTSYDPAFDGGPPGTAGTSLDFVKQQLVDDASMDGSIDALDIYPQIVFARRGH